MGRYRKKLEEKERNGKKQEEIGRNKKKCEEREETRRNGMTQK